MGERERGIEGEREHGRARAWEDGSVCGGEQESGRPREYGRVRESVGE